VPPSCEVPAARWRGADPDRFGTGSGAEVSGASRSTVVPAGGPGRILGAVSTRMLIILALICGLAVLVAFAVQAAQII
jgi:hypothetical protein